MTGTWSEALSQPRMSRWTRAAVEAADQIRRHPDMVETAAAVARRPVAVAIAPPSVEPLLRRHEMAHRIDKPAGALQRAEPLDLDRRMADDGQELLVRPHIGFERRDVEIADRDHRAPVAVRARRRTTRSARRGIAACARISGWLPDPARRRRRAHRDCAARSRPAARRSRGGSRRARTTPASSSPRRAAATGSRRRYSPSCRARACRGSRAPRTASRGKCSSGVLVSCRHRMSGCCSVEQPAHQIAAQPHRVDVPGDQTQCAPPRSGGKIASRPEPSRRCPKQKAPGRGGGPGACLSEALGGNPDPQGRRGRFVRGLWDPLRFWSLRWADAAEQEDAESCMRSSAQNACTKSGTFQTSILSCASFCRSFVPVAWQACAKAPNSARENGFSGALYSGCHCTPTTNRAPGQADRLDLPVRRHRLDEQAGGRPVDALAVQRVDHDLGGAAGSSNSRRLRSA